MTRPLILLTLASAVPVLAQETLPVPERWREDVAIDPRDAEESDLSTFEPAGEGVMKQTRQTAPPAPFEEARMVHALPPGMMGMGGPLDIANDWSRFDDGGKGYLTPLEFGRWVMESNGQDPAEVDASVRKRGADNPSVTLLNSTAAALAQADANHDLRITREELAAIAE